MARPSLQGAALAVALDWLHIAAMVAWLGGLVPLLLAVRAARRTPEQALPLAILIPRFSRLALPCVVLLTLTGIYAYLLHIRQLDLLAATTYGRALLIKLGIFGLLLLLGALNLGVLSRHLRCCWQSPGARVRSQRARRASARRAAAAGGRRDDQRGAQRDGMAGPRAARHDRGGPAGRCGAGAAGRAARIGDNEFAVDVVDRRPGAQDTPAQVLLRFDMQGMAMGVLQTEAKATGLERYTTRGSYTSMGGRWNVEVVLRRAGFDDVRHTFQLDLVRSAAQMPGA